MTVAPCATGVSGATAVDGPSPHPAWDVTRWVFGPRHPYRVNTFYRGDTGAVVTAIGAFDSAAAVADLTGALDVFHRLRVAVSVDVCHAVLGDVAVRALVACAGRRGRGPSSPAVRVAHADPDTARRVTLAGGTSLLA